MKKRWFSVMVTIVLSLIGLFVLHGLMKENRGHLSIPVLAFASNQGLKASTLTTPTVTAVDPSQSPNDVDMPIVIQGGGFTATLSGTVTITAPTVTLGENALPGVIWVNTTTMSATVPWGLTPNVYSMTVINPDGISTTLKNAFTVTNGIGVFTTDGPYGGDAVEIYKKPGEPSTVFALMKGVGLFRSENAGQSWALIYNQDDFCCSHGRLTFDAQNPDVIYIGSNLHRSIDGGDTWEKLWVFPDIPGGRPCSLNFPVAHPSLNKVVYVGYGCSDTEPGPGEAGVFRSDDYGETWITKTNGMTDTNIWALTIHPVLTQTLLAGTRSGRLYESTDGGESWSLTGQITRAVHTVQFNPYETSEAWLIAAQDYRLFAYRSTDLTTWEALDFDGNGNQCSEGTFSILTDTIWAVNRWDSYTSNDGGDNWTRVNTHSNAYAVEVTADNPDEVYLATGYGLKKSMDGGASWQDINQGLAAQVAYDIAASPLDPELVYAKTEQDIYRSYNGGQSWQALNYGGGGYAKKGCLAIDPYTHTRIYLGGSLNCDAGQFCIQISADAGETWALVTTTLPTTYTGLGTAYPYAVKPHPRVPGRILVGSSIWDFISPETYGMVFASDDYGQTWDYMGPTEPISPIMDIAYDAVDPDLVYMATLGTGHWKSTDGGATWNQMTFLRAGGIADEFAPHPTLSGHVILAAGSQTTQTRHGLFSSQDAGTTWTLLSEDYVGSPLVYAPTFPPTLYSKLESSQYSGLMRSFNNGQTWEQVPEAPYPVSLATTSDSARVVLYIGSPGGLASQVGVQAAQIDASNDESTLLGGGVYRLTTLLPTDWVYLPLAMRGHTP